jgi:hypothetical protein
VISNFQPSGAAEAVNPEASTKPAANAVMIFVFIVFSL